MKRILTFYDFIRFIYLRLNPRNGIFLFISIVTLSVSLISYFEKFMIVSSFTLVVGAIGIIYSIYKIRITVFTKPNFNYEDDEESLNIIKYIKLSQKHLAKGYKLIELGIDEKVVYSPEINKYLLVNKFDTTISKHNKNNLSLLLKRNSESFEKVLRYQYLDSINHNPPKLFFDESKVCLASDDFLDSNVIKLFSGSYYSSFLTNEFCQKKLTSRTSRVIDIFSGHNLYPVHKENGDYILKDISQSYLGNHIGISTIAFTKDYKIVVWRQANTSQQSSFKWVPTGSGSINWSDYTIDIKLNDLIQTAAERELLEESNKNNYPIKLTDLDTKLIGYYRWLNRGAKPEFCCVSKVKIDSFDLEPNEAEVDIPLQQKYIFEANNLPALLKSLTELVSSTNSSVSLKMNSRFLIESINSNDKIWEDFLEIN